MTEHGGPPRACNECSHSEDDHRYYCSTEDWDGSDVEERWECRANLECDCLVYWSDSPWGELYEQL